MNNHHLIHPTVISQPVPKPVRDTAHTMFNSDMGMLLLGMGLLWVGATLFSPKKGKISTGRFGGQVEKWAAQWTAWQQRDRRKPNQVSLKAGTLNIPEAQQGIAVCGAPNSGKTYSIIDPLIRDALRQGFPIVVYDYKGSQIEAHAAYASALGYEVHVFAPGFPYTGVCNPLDFVRDACDSLMAGQLAEVIYKNTRRGSNSSENDFFSNAGQKLVEAVMLLSKTTVNPDLFMAKKILNLPNLPTRIRKASEKEDSEIPLWTLESFSQLLSSEEAEKQVAGIVATAQRTFDRFVGKDLISSFIGKTTIPLDMVGRRILFLQVDTQKRDIVAPLIAAILHLIIARNFSQPRTEPLIVSLDELPTLHLDDLPKWINEFRSYGFCPILGYQNFAQLQHTYGRELSRAIFAACGTKIFFNPRDEETASLVSRYLGEKEVRLNTRSRNYGNQRSSSLNEQYQKVPVLSIDEVLKLDQGQCVFINPAYKGGGEASVPLKLKLKVPQSEIKIQNRSEQLWHQVARTTLIEWMAEFHFSSDELDLKAADYQDMAKRTFPLNESEEQPDTKEEDEADDDETQSAEVDEQIYNPDDYDNPVMER
jgi:type IV secretion system protein VirD4